MQPPRYSRVLAKIGAGRGQLLSEEKIKLFAEIRNLSEFTRQLGQTPYQEQISRISTPITSRKIERAFNENLIESFIKIVKNSPKRVEDFLNSYLLKIELENVKALLKAASSQLTYDQKVSKIYLSVEDYLKHREFFEDALKASSINQIVDVFKKMPYGSALNMGLKSYEESGSTACLDVFIDKFFYEELFERYEALPKNEQVQAFLFVSLQTDRFTLVTLFRGKALDYDPNWLRLAIPKKNFNLHDQTVEKMVSSVDFDTAFKIALRTAYDKFIVKAQTPLDTISNVEKLFDNAWIKLAKETIVTGMFSIASLLSFMAQKQVEVYNLTALSVGIESEIGPEDIRSQLLF
jgi:vacuolar-type H+-ATPase subunit C/Vma6